MNDKSRLKLFKTGKYDYIYIYYKLGANMLRIKTGNKFIKSYMTSEKFYTADMKNSEELNRVTRILKRKVDQYIFQKLQHHKPSVNQKECQAYINGDYEAPHTKPNQTRANQLKSLLAHYEDFYAFKQKELNNKPSVKDYLSLKNAITDYQEKKGIELKFDTINSIDFLVDFREFLSLKHEGVLHVGS